MYKDQQGPRKAPWPWGWCLMSCCGKNILGTQPTKVSRETSEPLFYTLLNFTVSEKYKKSFRPPQNPFGDRCIIAERFQKFRHREKNSQQEVRRYIVCVQPLGRSLSRSQPGSCESCVCSREEQADRLIGEWTDRFERGFCFETKKNTTPLVLHCCSCVTQSSPVHLEHVGGPSRGASQRLGGGLHLAHHGCLREARKNWGRGEWRGEGRKIYLRGSHICYCQGRLMLGPLALFGGHGRSLCCPAGCVVPRFFSFLHHMYITCTRAATYFVARYFLAMWKKECVKPAGKFKREATAVRALFCHAKSCKVGSGVSCLSAVSGV